MKKGISVIGMVLLFLASCSEKVVQEISDQEIQIDYEKIARNEAVERYVSALSDEVKISQLFLVNIEGSKNYAAVEKTGALYGNSKDGDVLLPGGCLLFGYNISETPEEFFDFLTGIRGYYQSHDNVPPFIAVDQEGGDVCRLKKMTTPFPSQKYLADWGMPQNAVETYESQARQMELLGIHMNLAPVVEVENSLNREFLGARTFGNIEKVLQYGQLEVDAFEKNGVATVLKHFPGNSNTDPHSGLPEISLTRHELENEYLLPFEKLCNSASAVLMSHARIHVIDDESVDSMTPAGLSSYWVTDVLRNRFGFEGIVFSDDIFMGALNKNGFPPEKAVLMAIDAGVDCIMLSEKRFGSVAGILLEKAKNDEDFARKINQACCRVIAYKAACGILDFVPVEGTETSGNKPVYELASRFMKVDKNAVMEEFKAEKKRMNLKGYYKY